MNVKLCIKPLTYLTTRRYVRDLAVVQTQWQRPLIMPHPMLMVAVGVVLVVMRVFESALLEKMTARAIQATEFSRPPMLSVGLTAWLEFPLEVREQVDPRTPLLTLPLHTASSWLSCAWTSANASIAVCCPYG